MDRRVSDERAAAENHGTVVIGYITIKYGFLVDLLSDRADDIAEIERLRAEVHHWKSNHDEMVARNQLLRGRRDLTAEQLAERMYLWQRLESVKKLEAENAELRARLDVSADRFVE